MTLARCPQITQTASVPSKMHYFAPRADLLCATAAAIYVKRRNGERNQAPNGTEQLDFGELKRSLHRPEICQAANLGEKETSQMVVMGIKLLISSRPT